LKDPARFHQRRLVDSEILARQNGRSTRKGRFNPEEPNTGDDDMDQWMREMDQKIADYQTINRVQTTLAALEAIANHVARIPAARNLIGSPAASPCTWASTNSR